jgi:hypothetical protein
MNLTEDILRERIRLLTNRNQRPSQYTTFDNNLIQTYRRILDEKVRERMVRQRMEQEESDGPRGGKKRRSKKSKRSSKPKTKKSCETRHMTWVQGCSCHIGYCRVKHNK